MVISVDDFFLLFYQYLEDYQVKFQNLALNSVDKGFYGNIGDNHLVGEWMLIKPEY